MVDKIKDLFYDYHDQFILWYEGLDEVSQYGLTFFAFVAAFAIIVFFLLSRITK